MRKCGVDGDDQSYDGVDTGNAKWVRVDETVFSMKKMLENAEIDFICN